MAERYSRLAVLALAVATSIALVALWPGDVDAPVSEGLAADTELAEVDEVTTAPAPPGSRDAAGRLR